MSVTRVLVVDDSPIFAEALCHVLVADPGIQVVGVAENGHQAIARNTELDPDVITMDVLMPELDGFEAVEKIMADRPKPILVLTGDARGRSGEMGIEALRRGALDLMVKPADWPGTPEQQTALRSHIQFLSKVAVVRHLAGNRYRWASRPHHPRGTRTLTPRRVAPAIIGLVASTGGPSALAEILGKLPPAFPVPVLVVQHLPSGFDESLRAWLDSVCSLPVRIADDGAILQPGTVAIARGGRDIRIGSDHRVSATAGMSSAPHCPSGTVLFHSIAESFGARGLGIVLTGMGRDGAEGLLAIHRAGGITVSQNEASSVVYGMPKASFDLGASEYVLDKADIAAFLCQCSETIRAGRLA